MLELERTFLAKFIPEGLEESPSKEIIDLYFPKTVSHPTLRIRKSGEKIEMTKKQPARDGDASELVEETIKLNEEEYKALSVLDCHRIEKVRYRYPYDGKTAEIDVFDGKLKGLVLVDFEFDNSEEKNNFPMPDFCLADVTQEEFSAGGILCSKRYDDIEEKLEKIGYKKISLS